MTGLLARFAGRVCEVLLPIKHDTFAGRGGGEEGSSSVAVCTLGSMKLLEDISRSEAMMERIALAGRLLSENKGIEQLVSYVLKHGELRYIILCGRDARGHLPGQALLALHRDGIDAGRRIIGARGKDPVLEGIGKEEVDEFRRSITIVDLIGTEDIDAISSKVNSLVRVQ